MTTYTNEHEEYEHLLVVDTYRLDRYDNITCARPITISLVVEAYRLDRYDNLLVFSIYAKTNVVEAYRLDRYDNSMTAGNVQNTGL